MVPFYLLKSFKVLYIISWKEDWCVCGSRRIVACCTVTDAWCRCGLFKDADICVSYLDVFILVPYSYKLKYLNIIPVTSEQPNRWNDDWLKAWQFSLEWGRWKCCGSTASSNMTTGSCLRSDSLIWVDAQSFPSPSSTYLLGEPGSTGSVSGRVSRCSAQTSAPCASAHWTGNVDTYFLFSCKLCLNTLLAPAHFSFCVIVFHWCLYSSFPPSTRTIKSGFTDLRGH